MEKKKSSSKYNKKTTGNDTMIVSVTKKIEEKMKKIATCKEECKKCTHEIKILRKELKKSVPTSPKVAKMLTKWLSQKEKMTTKVHKLKEDCKKYNTKLKDMKTKMRKTHMKKGVELKTRRVS